MIRPPAHPVEDETTLGFLSQAEGVAWLKPMKQWGERARWHELDEELEMRVVR
jgi:hypothetical protein